MRRLLFLALTIPAAAQAAMMTHTDLASLALESDVIVRATRGAPSADATQPYRVDAILYGSGVEVGQTIAIDQRLYVTDDGMGRTPVPPLEPTAYLFLHRNSDGQIELVGSGLRVIAGGLAYRFEQHSNPGPYVAVPQQSGIERTPGSPDLHWTQAQLEAGITVAIGRAAQARVGIASHDRRALVALMPPPRSGDELPSFGFYQDGIGRRAFAALVAADDLEGALDVLGRLQGEEPFGVQVSDTRLLDVIERADAPEHMRRAALRLLDMMPSADTIARLLALARGNEQPSLRAAVLQRLPDYSSVSGTDPTWPRRQRLLMRDLRALIAERLPLEQSPRMRVAWISAAADCEMTGVAGRTSPLAAFATRTDGVLSWTAVALPPAVPGLDRIEVRRIDGTTCGNVTQTMGSQHGSRGQIDVTGCGPTFDLVLAMRRGRRVEELHVPIE